jgi:hypothetical protein
VPDAQRLEQNRDAGAYSLAANGAGDRVVVVPRDLWPKPYGVDVFSATRGSPFGTATLVRGGSVPNYLAAAAVGPDGTVAVVGVPRGFLPGENVPAPDRLMALTRPPGGGFSDPVAISAEGPDDPTVAFDRQGNATAIWVRGNKVEQSSRPPGGNWSAPTVISRDAYAGDFQLAFDARGNALAAWTRTGASLNKVVTAIRPAGGSFGPAQVVSNPRFDSGEPSLSVNAAGSAALVWVSNTRNDAHFRVGGAFRKPSGRFGRPRFLTPTRADGVGASVALDARGRALITWIVDGDREPGVDTFLVRAAFRSRSGRLSSPKTISGPRADFNELAMDPAGHAVVAWVYHGHRNDVVQARRVTTAGRIGPLIRVSPRGLIDRLETLVDDAGSATFTWVRGHGLETRTLPP